MTLCVLAGVLCAISFTACSTMLTTKYQQVYVVAPGGTELLRDGEFMGEVPRGQTDVTLIVRRGLRKFTLTAVNPRYETLEFEMVPGMNLTVLFNILLGPGLVIGLPVDLASGAAGEYPNYVEIHMEPLR